MTQRANMLALVTDAYGGCGGIAQYNRDFLGSLAEMKVLWSITILPRQAPDPPEPPEGVRQLPARSGRIRYSVVALRTVLMQPVDLVFCGHLFMAPLAALIARLKHAKLVIQTHGIEAWSRPSKWQRAAVERADLVLSVSRHTRAAVLSWAAIAPERLVVVPNTVREMFTPGDGPVQRVVRGSEGKRVLLTVGRMDSTERYKGHDRLIAALPELVGQGHDVCYLIVGEGDDRPRLECVALEAGVKDRVLFLGAVDSQTLSEIYRSADLFVMPSTGEGFGVAFLEAMASGTPAIGLNVGGAPDALGDGELGASVQQDVLSEVIARLLDGGTPNRATLATAVRTRFGRDKFKVATSLVMSRLLETS